MDKYLFRGQEISGVHAYSLLRAVKIVLSEVPNPTLEDVAQLALIVIQFEKQFTDSLREHAGEIDQVAQEWSDVDADGLGDFEQEYSGGHDRDPDDE